MVQSAQTAEATERAIEVTQAFSRAMVAGDADALEELLAYIHMSARVEPREGIIPSVRDGRKNRRMDFEDLSSASYPGAVLVRGLNHMTTGGDPGMEFDARFTAAVVDVGGAWKLATYHSTRVPEA
jgi:hypothetical protein